MTPTAKIPYKLIFIFFFSLATHVPGLFSPIFDYHGWAQTLRASVARNYYENGMHFFNPQVDYFEESFDRAPQFPLYSYLVAVCYKVFGFNDAWGRVVSAFFAALSAIFLYLLARLYMKENAAFLSAFVFCVIPIRIYFMRAFMPESMAIFSLIAGTYFCAVWADSGRLFPWGILAWGFLTLCALLKLPYLPLLFPAGFILYKKWGARAFIRRDFIIVAVLFAAAYLGWYGHANAGLEKSKGFFIWLMNLMGVFREWSNPEFWSVHFLSRFPELLTTYAGLVFFAAGFYSLWKEKAWFFVVWFFTVVGYILACGEYGRVHQYASLPFAPVNACFIASGIVWSWEKFKTGNIKIYLVLLVVSIPVHAFFRIKHWYRLDELWVMRAQAVVEKISQPNDLFFINAPDEPFFLYHLHRKGFVGQIEKTGTDYLVKARNKGAKFLLTPLARGPNAADSMFAKEFRQVYRDDDFAIYDISKK